MPNFRGSRSAQGGIEGRWSCRRRSDAGAGFPALLPGGESARLCQNTYDRPTETTPLVGFATIGLRSAILHKREPPNWVFNFKLALSSYSAPTPTSTLCNPALGV